MVWEEKGVVLAEGQMGLASKRNHLEMWPDRNQNVTRPHWNQIEMPPPLHWNQTVTQQVQDWNWNRNRIASASCPV